MEKAKGGSDQFGRKWHPLSMSTLSRKYYRSRPKTAAKTKGRLTPELTRMWRGIYYSKLKKGKSSVEAAQIAWAIVKAKGGLTGLPPEFLEKVLINIETHTLEKSLRPGTINIREARYTPRPNQQATIDGAGNYQIGSTVPYASEVNEQRPYLQKNDPIIGLAKAQAKAKIKEIIDGQLRKKSMADDNKKRAKRRT